MELTPITKQESNFICYFNRSTADKKYTTVIRHRTIIWLNEEFHEVNCEPNILLVENRDFISKGFESV